MQINNDGGIDGYGYPIDTKNGGNEWVGLVIRYELYIAPVKTYVLDEFYNTEA